MLTQQRKTLILDRLAREGEIVARTLAAELTLSEDTIRRDLRELAAEGKLVRVHGGALPATPPLPDLEERRRIGSDEKSRLGAAAAGLIRPGETVFIDGGTTTAALVRALPHDLALTVITHSPTIAAALEHHGGIRVILIGGQLYRHSMVAVGAEAMAAISRLRPDHFFLGATAAHPRHGLSTGDFEEAAIKRAIAGRSLQVHATLTAEKLHRVSPFTILPLAEVTSLFLPDGTPEDSVAPYRGQGPEIYRA